MRKGCPGSQQELSPRSESSGGKKLSRAQQTLREDLRPAQRKPKPRLLQKGFSGLHPEWGAEAVPKPPRTRGELLVSEPEEAEKTTRPLTWQSPGPDSC